MPRIEPTLATYKANMLHTSSFQTPVNLGFKSSHRSLYMYIYYIYVINVCIYSNILTLKATGCIYRQESQEIVPKKSCP